MNATLQKPRVEKNHTLFRDIVPKGKPLNGKSPYEVFTFT